MESELKKAVNLYEKGQLNSAKEIALHIYNSKPDYFDNLRLLNFIHFKNGDFSDAIKIINEAIKINPNYARAYNNKGYALQKIKKLDESIKNFSTTLKINPNFDLSCDSNNPDNKYAMA